MQLVLFVLSFTFKLTTMKKNTLSAFIAFVLVFGSACENKRTTEEHTTTTVTEKDTTVLVDENVGMEQTSDSTKIVTGKPGSPIYTSDAAFVMMALSADKLEVELGKIAAKKGTSADVKQFGQQLVDDHSKAFIDLLSIAEKKKWEVPLKMLPVHKATFDHISKLTGKDFDKEFVAEMLKDHEMDIAEFEEATKKAADTDLKAFASKTLPTLRTHLDKAREIDAKMSEQP
jgi:putative membrane protein